MSSSFVTPLRYPGGKARLGKWLSHIISYNSLKESTYIEPYAGGAGAAMYLLTNGHVKNILINDLDKGIYAFWWSLLNRTESFIELIETTKVNMTEWEQQRKISEITNTENLLELGFATFFMNRTNRSGITKGGVIGGKRQDGNYKLDARFNKNDLIKRIKKIASYKENIVLRNIDAIELLSSISSYKEREFMLFLDPPYFNKGALLYRDFYALKDHISIAQKVKEMDQPWVMTYDNCDEIRAIYKNIQSREFSFKYSTHLNRPVGKEILFFKNIKIPVSPFLKR